MSVARDHSLCYVCFARTQGNRSTGGAGGQLTVTTDGELATTQDPDEYHVGIVVSISYHEGRESPTAKHVPRTRERESEEAKIEGTFSAAFHTLELVPSTDIRIIL